MGTAAGGTGRGGARCLTDVTPGGESHAEETDASKDIAHGRRSLTEGVGVEAVLLHQAVEGAARDVGLAGGGRDVAPAGGQEA